MQKVCLREIQLLLAIINDKSIKTVHTDSKLRSLTLDFSQSDGNSGVLKSQNVPLIDQKHESELKKIYAYIGGACKLTP